ncbi:MAG: adenylate/guanylate cyclase domain-containing protein [Pseudomonadota bacterium]
MSSKSWRWSVAIALFALLACTLARAQSGPAVVPVAAAQEHLELIASTFVLEDRDGTLRLEDVQSPALRERFRQRSTRIGMSASAFWMRVKLSNNAARDLNRWFDSGNWTLQEVEFFAPDAAGHYQRQSASSLAPFAARPLPTTTFVFPLTLPAGQAVEVYLRVRCTGYVGVFARPQLWQQHAYEAEKAGEKIQWFVYLGMGGALGLFNFLLYLSVRDPNYRRYVYSMLAMVSTVSMNAGSLGFAPEYLWPTLPFAGQLAFALIAFPNVFFPFHFAFHFIGQYPSIPRVLRAIQICIALVGLLSLVDVSRVLLPDMVPSIVAQGAFFLAMTFMTLLMLGVMIGNTILVLRGSRRALWMAIAWTPICLAFLELTVMPFTHAFPSRTHAMWASAFELVFMALALADRINIDRKTREMAQAEVVDVLRRSEAELEDKVKQRTVELTRERSRAQELLHNILPVELAAELSRTGSARTVRHESATVMFTDFSSFTQAVATMPADRMVSELNEIFAAFDDIADACGIEKIKTIGDAYMAAAGLPLPCADHAVRCVRAALAMQAFLDERNRSASFKWGLRVGIHSGPVVAGVVGKRKYAFDIWGDTVNIASRMESAGQPGKVNVSAYTFDLIQRDFACEYRGKVAAKGKGEIDMYFVGAAISPQVESVPV